eukprot:TRINITY_DN27187_c0_g1_i1.p1 TRINITY_DN27187_c0_g1~~TRINITY_DN27187_c0_g1_i1.p1  ORF type:complete len:129 (+),score=16.86 TRINITY_DN27187_c0_g1_i1:90-476(+)
MASRKELFATNSWKTRSASEHVHLVQHLTLDSQYSRNFGKMSGNPKETDLDWHMGSSATTFARGGIKPGLGLKGTYVRDPHTGVWFKDGKIGNPLFQPQRSRSCSVLCNRQEMVPMNHVNVALKRQPL